MVNYLTYYSMLQVSQITTLLCYCLGKDDQLAERVALEVLLPGHVHGSYQYDCCEFLPLSNLFYIDDNDNVFDLSFADSGQTGVNVVLIEYQCRGLTFIANEYGTWWYGRSGKLSNDGEINQFTI